MNPLLNLVILGSTGSVGTSTLDVVARHPGRFHVVGLTAQQRVDVLFEQCRRFRPRVAVLPTEPRAAELRRLLAAEGLVTEVRVGPEALCELAAASEVDAVMAAIVGAAGLRPCMAAARAGKRLLLANKEALVVGGGLFMQAVAAGAPRCCPSTANTPPSSSACPRTARPGRGASTTSCSPPAAARSASATRRRCTK